MYTYKLRAQRGKLFRRLILHRVAKTSAPPSKSPTLFAPTACGFPRVITLGGFCHDGFHPTKVDYVVYGTVQTQDRKISEIAGSDDNGDCEPAVFSAHCSPRHHRCTDRSVVEIIRRIASPSIIGYRLSKSRMC